RGCLHPAHPLPARTARPPRAPSTPTAHGRHTPQQEVHMAVIVYMTAPNPEEAERIGRILVERRLAACVNVLGSIRSIYHWAGDIQTETETAFIAKTTDALVPALTEAVLQLHPYEVPCVATLPITGGSAAFLGWIDEVTRKEP
ncbi:divalent-cation tolerance protein CutA, partial [Nitratidesulfovibrio oxamicus]